MLFQIVSEVSVCALLMVTPYLHMTHVSSL